MVYWRHQQGQTASRESALTEKARELKDFFSAQASASEARGMLTDATLSALGEGGFLGMWMPRCFGGAEVWPVEALATIEALSYADGSTGWVFMATQVGTSTAAAYLEPSAANALFAERWPIIAGQGAPMGRAEVVPNGFRLSGHGRYGSGLLHAEYVHTGALVFEDGLPRMLPGTNIPEARIFVLPRSEAQLLDNWDVLGLRATGSVDYTIEDVFVPEEFTHLQAEHAAKQGGDLYRLGIQGMGAIGHTGFALGVGRRALDELAALARADSARSSMLSQSDGNEAFHQKFASAEASLRAARSFAYDAQRDIEAALKRHEDPTTREITLARLALNHTTSAIAEVCTFAYQFGGGVSLRAGTLQRCFRDIYTGTQHSTTSPMLLRECGRELLGLAEGRVWGSRGLVDRTT